MYICGFHMEMHISAKFKMIFVLDFHDTCGEGYIQIQICFIIIKIIEFTIKDTISYVNSAFIQFKVLNKKINDKRPILE